MIARFELLDDLGPLSGMFFVYKASENTPEIPGERRIPPATRRGCLRTALRPPAFSRLLTFLGRQDAGAPSPLVLKLRLCLGDGAEGCPAAQRLGR
jgi:hypothetical protein